MRQRSDGSWKCFTWDTHRSKAGKFGSANSPKISYNTQSYDNLSLVKNGRDFLTTMFYLHYIWTKNLFIVLSQYSNIG
jgi:hypothetical protein